MVKGGHAENTLSMGGLEIDHLDDVREGLRDIDDTHQDEDEGHIECKGQSAHRAPQEQGPGVAHKDLGRIVVVEQERAQAAEEGAAEDPQVRDTPVPGHGGEKGRYRQGDTLEERPSTPSVMFTAFTVPTMTKAAKTM